MFKLECGRIEIATKKGDSKTSAGENGQGREKITVIYRVSHLFINFRQTSDFRA